MRRPSLDPSSIRRRYGASAHLADMHQATGPGDIEHLRDGSGGSGHPEAPLCAADPETGVWVWRLDRRGREAVKRATCGRCSVLGNRLVAEADKEASALRRDRERLREALAVHDELLG